MSFSDPQQLINNENNLIPYGVYRYQQIIDECFIISKNINTSYLDLMNISLRERDRMLEIIVEDNKKQKEEIEKIKRKKR